MLNGFRLLINNTARTLVFTVDQNGGGEKKYKRLKWWWFMLTKRQVRLGQSGREVVAKLIDGTEGADEAIEKWCSVNPKVVVTDIESVIFKWKVLWDDLLSYRDIELVATSTLAKQFDTLFTHVVKLYKESMQLAGTPTDGGEASTNRIINGYNFYARYLRQLARRNKLVCVFEPKFSRRYYQMKEALESYKAYPGALGLSVLISFFIEVIRERDAETNKFFTQKEAIEKNLKEMKENLDQATLWLHREQKLQSEVWSKVYAAQGQRRDTAEVTCSASINPDRLQALCDILTRDANQLVIERLAAKCIYCNAKNPLKICSGCSIVRYCSSACQTSHWPNHKKCCYPAAAATSIIKENLK
jgi:hypothetical protein